MNTAKANSRSFLLNQPILPPVLCQQQPLKTFKQGHCINTQSVTHRELTPGKLYV